VVADIVSGRGEIHLRQHQSRRKAVKVLTMLVLASVLGLSSAVARADTPAPKKEPTAKTQAIAGAGAVKLSQQDQMRPCAKDANGKKWPEHKAFMKTCLSTKKA
jgi:psiF repeat